MVEVATRVVANKEVSVLRRMSAGATTQLAK